jgi:rod shape-determining protein MreD
MGGMLHRVDVWFRLMLPLAMTILLSVVGIVPWRIPDVALVTPALSLLAVYLWSVRRPALLPPIAVFLIGASQDVINAAPLGVSALVLLLVQFVVRLQRRQAPAGRTFLLGWGGFLAVAAGAGALDWLLTSALLSRWLDPTAEVYQYLLTVLLYPPVALIVDWINRALPVER